MSISSVHDKKMASVCAGRALGFYGLMAHGLRPGRITPVSLVSLT
jgi:hypothetical protein